MVEPQRETQEWKREVTKIRDELRFLADELRLKIHLAGMEAKDTWNELEPKVFDFEQRYERAAQTTANELRELGKDLKSRLQKIRDSL